MVEFWETHFKQKQKMWGEDAAPAAQVACEYFQDRGVQTVLIPGIGYGRNAKPFLAAGMSVTGIEISKTAIAIAEKEGGLKGDIFYGSVTDMPFSAEVYDGIFCYAVIHLLDEAERKKLIADCYNQLAPGGVMVFVMVSTKAASYGAGLAVGRNRFEQHGGARIYFYDEAAVRDEFDSYSLREVREISEKTRSNEMKFLMAICTKD